MPATKTEKETETAIQTVEVSQVVQAATIERVYREAKIVTDEALALKVKDYKTSDQANLLAKRVNAGRKAVDAVRKQVLAEPKRFTDTVNAMFKPILSMCTDALTHLDTERDTFARTEDAELKAAQAEAAKKEATRQKISIAKGGDGSNIKPVAQPVDMQKVRSTDVKRRIPDREAIQKAIDEATKKIKVSCPLDIPGVSIYSVWKFDIIDAAGVPDEYRKNSFVDA